MSVRPLTLLFLCPSEEGLDVACAYLSYSLRGTPFPYSFFCLKQSLKERVRNLLSLLADSPFVCRDVVEVFRSPGLVSVFCGVQRSESFSYSATLFSLFFSFQQPGWPLSLFCTFQLSFLLEADAKVRTFFLFPSTRQKVFFLFLSTGEAVLATFPLIEEAVLPAFPLSPSL